MSRRIIVSSLAVICLLGGALLLLVINRSQYELARQQVMTVGNNGGTAMVLVFSKTAGYRHASIEDGIKAIRKLASQHSMHADFTEDAAVFTAENLARYKAVVFLSTTGTVLDGEQKAAFEHYIHTGGGYAGIHSATDTEHDWAWYGKLVGAFFQSHPHIAHATIDVEDSQHSSTSMLPKSGSGPTSGTTSGRTHAVTYMCY